MRKLFLIFATSILFQASSAIAGHQCGDAHMGGALTGTDGVHFSGTITVGMHGNTETASARAAIEAAGDGSGSRVSYTVSFSDGSTLMFVETRTTSSDSASSGSVSITAGSGRFASQSGALDSRSSIDISEGRIHLNIAGTICHEERNND